MSELDGKLSPTGVWIANDFRDNLIIDRYDSVFVSMRASKRNHLHSQNSEDAVTWNVFRSLRQIDPIVWMPALSDLAFGDTEFTPSGSACLSLWVSVPPPPGLVLELDEGLSEIDVVIESPTWVWFIEAKYRSDISPGTTTRPDRDQVLRNIDVGTYYAGVRPFFFSLLVRNASASPAGSRAVEEYRYLDTPRRLLAEHRPDGLRNLQAVSLLSWANLAKVLVVARDNARRPGEADYADRAFAWMESKKLA